MKLSHLIERLAPRLIWQRRIKTWRIYTGESEAQFLSRLVDRNRTSIDIGAADGTYTVALVPLSKRVIAFEPIPEKARRLEQMFARTSLVSVRQVALSDRDGRAVLKVPTDRPWQSTIEAGNALVGRSGISEVVVTRATLDSFGLKGVGFVKIDVEGHELAVLKGAAKTIEQERPNILVEVEERHRKGAVATVADFMSQRSYLGYFILNGKVRAIAEFDQAVHQDPTNLEARSRRIGTYINNFIFVPAWTPLLAEQASFA